jgi:hypothetical protein
MFKGIASFLDVFSRTWIEFRGYDLGDLNLMIATRDWKSGKNNNLLILTYFVREGGKEIKRVLTEIVSENYPAVEELSRNAAEFLIPRHGKEAELVREYAKKWYSRKCPSTWRGKSEKECEILKEILRIAEEFEKEVAALRKVRGLKPSSV